MQAETQSTKKGNTPPENFVKQVKDGLEHLYDFAYLQRHALAQEDETGAEHPGETPGQGLRRELMAAIETLKPGADTPFRAPHARLYNLLLLHYVEGMNVQETARELGISRRQAHRDLQHGGESVAAILWSRRADVSAKRTPATQLSSIEAEMARLEPHPRPTEAQTLLQHAQAAVAPMAAQRSVTFDIEFPPTPTVISTDPIVARQVLVNTLSHAVDQARPGVLTVVLKVASREKVTLNLCYVPVSTDSAASTLDQVVTQLADRLGWQVKQENLPSGLCTITLEMTPPCSTVLIIDDNAGLVELLSDYLTGHACRVVTAMSGPEGLRLAQEHLPDAAILDVMMPEMDGWELLQRLRAHPRTANMPIIVCSVINNPSLAYSLGASLFLTKPVSRDNILNALRQLGVV